MSCSQPPSQKVGYMQLGLSDLTVTQATAEWLIEADCSPVQMKPFAEIEPLLISLGLRHLSFVAGISLSARTYCLRNPRTKSP